MFSKIQFPKFCEAILQDAIKDAICAHFDGGCCYVNGHQSEATCPDPQKDCSDYKPSYPAGFCHTCGSVIFPQDQINAEQCFCPNCNDVTSIISYKPHPIIDPRD